MAKVNMNFRTCNTNTSDIPLITENVVNGKDYVFLGEDNDLPNHFLELYNECSILQSIINGTADYVAGKGIEGEDFIVNRNNETINEILAKVATDYVIFGAFSLQVIRNKKGDIAEVNYIDVRNIRLSEDATRVYYNKQWGKYARGVKEYERFNKFVNSPSTIVYIKNPKSRGIYGYPIWSSAIRDIYTLVESTKQNLSNMQNNFSPNVLISFCNGTPSEEVQDMIETAIIEKYTSSNGNKILLSFADSKETAPEISTFSTEDYTTKYQTVMNASRNTILSAFRASGQLFGVLPEQTGFNSVEYKEAFTLFNETVIAPIQREIEKAFKTLGYDIKLKPFNIDFNNENKDEVVE